MPQYRAGMLAGHQQDWQPRCTGRDPNPGYRQVMVPTLPLNGFTPPLESRGKAKSGTAYRVGWGAGELHFPPQVCTQGLSPFLHSCPSLQETKGAQQQNSNHSEDPVQLKASPDTEKVPCVCQEWPFPRVPPLQLQAAPLLAPSCLSIPLLSSKQLLLLLSLVCQWTTTHSGLRSPSSCTRR